MVKSSSDLFANAASLASRFMVKSLSRMLGRRDCAHPLE
jgi:hypothetical protein